MKVHLACSGGLANLRIEGRLDTSELPGDVAVKVESALGEESLAAAQRTKGRALVMDGEHYELTVLPDDPEGEVRRYRLDDAALSEEMLEAIDELRGEIVRRKAAER